MFAIQKRFLLADWPGVQVQLGGSRPDFLRTSCALLAADPRVAGVELH